MKALMKALRGRRSAEWDLRNQAARNQPLEDPAIADHAGGSTTVAVAAFAVAIPIRAAHE